MFSDEFPMKRLWMPNVPSKEKEGGRSTVCVKDAA